MTTVTRTIPGSPVTPGKTVLIFRESSAAADTRTAIFSIDSDSVLVSLYVGLIASGTLDVTVYTVAEEGQETAIVSFPQILGPTTELLLKKSAVALSTIKIVVVTTGIASFDIRAKAIGSGESSVKIQGANDWQVSQTDIPAVATLVIPVSLTDRSGLVIKNFDAAADLYLAESAAKCTLAIAYPIGPGESLAMDLSAGQEVWGISSAGVIDVRIAEAGN